MTDPLTPADAARLLEGTTPGPWAVEGSYIMDPYRSQIITLLGDMAEAYPEAGADSDLIAAAPALAEALAAREGWVPLADHRFEMGRLRDEIEIARVALQAIADEDYRGPQPIAHVIAQRYFQKPGNGGEP